MAAPVQDAIILLGDSITQYGWDAGCFAQRLAQDYVRKLDVLNRGFSGYNTDWAIPVFRQCLSPPETQSLAQKIRLLTIWYGANDAEIPPYSQHVPLERYQTNLETLIHMAPRDTRVVLITPPPVNDLQWGKRVEIGKPVDRQFEVTKKYAEVAKSVGIKEGVPIVDTWTALWEAAGNEQKGLDKYLSDGLHLTIEGYNIVYYELMKVIKESLPELYHENLQEVFPLWDKIDTNNPLQSLEKREV